MAKLYVKSGDPDLKPHSAECSIWSESALFANYPFEGFPTKSLILSFIRAVWSPRSRHGSACNIPNGHNQLHHRFYRRLLRMRKNLWCSTTTKTCGEQGHCCGRIHEYSCWVGRCWSCYFNLRRQYWCNWNHKGTGKDPTLPIYSVNFSKLINLEMNLK